MAKYVIPQKTIIVKCYRCGTLYVPDMEKNEFSPYFKDFDNFEPCPVCGTTSNGFRNTIPLWKYNLIKFFRGGFREQNGH